MKFKIELFDWRNYTESEIEIEANDYAEAARWANDHINKLHEANPKACIGINDIIMISDEVL